MGAGVKVLVWLEDCDIRLRLGVVGQLNWILHAYDSAVAQLATEKSVNPHDDGSVTWTNRTHLTDFTIDQLDAIIFAKNANFSHSCEVSHGKLPVLSLDRHMFYPPHNADWIAVPDRGMIA